MRRRLFMQRLFRVGYLVWSIVPCALGAAALWHPESLFSLFSLGVISFALAWCGAGLGLLRERRWAGSVAVVLVVVPWIPAALQTFRRVVRVSTGTMEGPDGHGSPLAFMLGFVVEQLVFFVPLTFLLVCALFGRIQKRPPMSS